jgi:hypothetical protein
MPQQVLKRVPNDGSLELHFLNIEHTATKVKYNKIDAVSSGYQKACFITPPIVQ